MTCSAYFRYYKPFISIQGLKSIPFLLTRASLFLDILSRQFFITYFDKAFCLAISVSFLLVLTLYQDLVCIRGVGRLTDKWTLHVIVCLRLLHRTDNFWCINFLTGLITSHSCSFCTCTVDHSAVLLLFIFHWPNIIWSSSQISLPIDKQTIQITGSLSIPFLMSVCLGTMTPITYDHFSSFESLATF